MGRKKTGGLSPGRRLLAHTFGKKGHARWYPGCGLWATRGVYDQNDRKNGGHFGLLLAPLFLFLLPEIFTDDVRVGQVVVRSLEDEVGAPDSEEPADPSEDQPWVDVRIVPVRERGTGVGKGSLESPKVAIRGRDQVGFVGSYNNGGGNRGTENGEDCKYRAGSFDSIPHYGLRESRPEEKEEEHGTLVEHRY